ncbi:3749_t:CDS:2, partial [Gigaspora margarita]
INRESAEGLVGVCSSRIKSKHARRRGLTWKDDDSDGQFDPGEFLKLLKVNWKQNPLLDCVTK